ncbi:hypothetical protein [Nocardia sp. BMG111209]|uniref:hypothetical protein n=1 Tax=Nocardia sp. BMG111209 TaxID=1160137 RepID=UPI0003764F25|nr:hypothetical protein [Nocardia sp. BMG111209]
MTLDEVTAELYGIPPAEFVATRTERVRQARDAGDKALAAAIGGLRRPTVAAWAVNLLARADGDEVGALLTLGDALRDAQRRLSGERLRTLTTQRQQVVNALTRKAGELAAAAGQPPSESVLRDIGTTLNAALADPAVADRVRGGTLTAAASYEGFGPAGLTAVPGEPEAERTVTRPAKSAGKPRAPRPDPRDEARRELERLRGEIETAGAAVTSAETEHEAAGAELAAAESAIAGLRAELARAEDRRRFTAAAERAAREKSRRARQQLQGLEQRAEKMREQQSAG